MFDEAYSVGQLEVLVGELVAVDGLSTGSVVVGEVTSLEHELGCKLSRTRLWNQHRC
jgi:hypothetical protein